MENEKKQSASIKTPHNNHQKQSPFFNGHPAGVAQKVAEPFFNPNPQNAFFNPITAPTVQTKADATHNTPATKSENKTGLPDNLKTGVENLSGMDISDVKVHYNSKKPPELNAHAYAQGSDIHVAAGQEKHLAHEAWHVVQQKQGRVQPTVQMKTGVAMNDDRIVRLISIGTPVDKYDFEFLQECEKPILFVHGDQDEFGKVERLQELFNSLTKTDDKEMVIFENCGHFFDKHLNELREAIKNWTIARI